MNHQSLEKLPLNASVVSELTISGKRQTTMPKRKGPLDWQPETISRFWEHFSSTPHYQAVYFSNMVGRGIANFLRLTGKLAGDVLDFGCGPGYLAGYLLDLGLPLRCWGADASEASVKSTNERLAGRAGWQGAFALGKLPSDFPAQSFDVVTCIETLEHLTDEVLQRCLEEIKRILRPEGMALFTTPHDENLETGLTYCPFCDTEFHRMQHVRSFSTETLEAWLKRAGFRALFCQGIDLASFQRPYPSRADIPGWRGLRALAVDRLCRWRDRRQPLPFPHGREFRRLLVRGPHLCAVVSPQPEA
ncbi:MAG TPA: class I SAM-dependent methyltransferase [Gemmataceae bacterium]|nr:class I SAM-dependent methyltransferase [Gemmataceae bacterium]